MAKQFLRDPDIQPADAVLAAALGKSYKTYAAFSEMLPDFEVNPQWRYYNDGKAWLAKGLYQWKSVRGSDKEKTVFWLSVWDGFFKLSFFIGEKHRAELRALPLGESVKSMIDEAKQMGKLKFFPLIFEVSSDERFNDLRILIEFQKNIK